MEFLFLLTRIQEFRLSSDWSQLCLIALHYYLNSTPGIALKSGFYQLYRRIHFVPKFPESPSPRAP